MVVMKQKLETGMGDGLLQTHHKYGGNSQKIKILAHILLSLEPNPLKAYNNTHCLQCLHYSSVDSGDYGGSGTLAGHTHL